MSSTSGMLLGLTRRSLLSHAGRRDVRWLNTAASSSSVPVVGNSSPQALLAYYSQWPTRTVQLEDLKMYGSAPLDERTLLESAERTRKELLAGLARRVTQHLSLPFLPATNPSLSKVHNLYSTSFFDLANIPEVTSLKINAQLCDMINAMVNAHTDNIPLLARGFNESRKYLPDAVITDFLDRAIRNRISLRLMAEQHLALSRASLDRSSTTPSRSRIGVLDLDLSPHELVHTCAEYSTLLCDSTYGVSPPYRIEGVDPDLRVKFIGTHLEYILTELLKNAFRATVENHAPKPTTAEDDEDDGVFRFEDTPHAHLLKEDFPPIVVTIGSVPGALTIRVRDQGGGVPPENVQSIFSYAFTSVPVLPDPDSDPDSPSVYGGTTGAGYMGGVGGGPQGGESALQTNVGTLAGLGFGLPLSRIYAEYFSGSLDLVSMYGWGTDVYCVVRTAE